MSATMLDRALALAARGYEVFPCAGKAPAIAKRDGGNGCLDASADPAAIRALWHGRVNANIGIHVPETQLVVDVDPRYGGDVDMAALEAEHGALPATRTVLSGRGDGGSHRYYLHPGGVVTGSRMPKGIDLKRRGGYVIAPPSVHPDTGRQYRWADTREPVPLPEWFAALIRPLEVTRTAPRGFDPLLPSGERRLEALVQFVLDSVNGTRNDRLFWAACRGHEMALEGQGTASEIRYALQLAAEAVGSPSLEVERTIGSAFAPGRVSA